MPEAGRKPCPKCGRPMLVLAGPEGRPLPEPKCLSCDKIDPLKSEQMQAWSNSEALRPPGKAE